MSEFIKNIMSKQERDVLMPTEFTRVEVIGEDGREYVLNRCVEVSVSIQDEGKTLKLFVKRG